MSQLGIFIKQVRLKKHLTQKELANGAAFSFSLISALESGHRKYVETHHIEELAKALDLPESALWEKIPEGKSNQRYKALH